MADFTGRTLGQYEILEKIGQGGMGSVYRAYDPTTDREVAVKVLPPQLTVGPEFLARFQNEGKVIARLEHPHILPLYAVGEQGGIPYLVMRYVTGGSLQDRIRARRVDNPFLVRTISQVADALEEAHRQGIVHRDVKPGNILLDHNDNAYLADFGIAKMLESSQYLSMSGGGIGTPAFMPPEQWRGKKLDGRADIYALGCVVFLIVTGSRPYEADTRDGMMSEHLFSPVPSAWERNQRISPELDALLQRAMAKDASDRPATVAEFAHDLAAALAGRGKAPAVEPPSAPSPLGQTKPKTPRPAPPVPIGETPARPRVPVWGAVGGGVLVVTLALAGLVFGGALGQPTPTAAPALTALVTDSSVEGLVATITAQAALHTAPSATPTINPTDTPLPTATPTQTAAYTPTATQQVSTSVPQVAPTRTQPPATVNQTCAQSGTQNWVPCTVSVNCTGYFPQCLPECRIFKCFASYNWPSIMDFNTCAAGCTTAYGHGSIAETAPDGKCYCTFYGSY